MSNTKFTKGPWKFNTTKTALLGFNSKNEHSFIYNASPYKSIEPTNADAALIAAAPEMYEELSLVFETFKRLNMAYEPIDRLLKKARGEK